MSRSLWPAVQRSPSKAIGRRSLEANYANVPPPLPQKVLPPIPSPQPSFNAPCDPELEPCRPCNPKPTEPTPRTLEVLHVFSGAGDPSKDATTLARIVERLSAEHRHEVQLKVVEYDLLNCPCSVPTETCKYPQDSRGIHATWHCGNLLRDRVYQSLLADCAEGRFGVVVAGIPCDGYCKARFRSEDGEGGPPPLRRREWPTGTPWTLDEPNRRALARSNTLTVRGFSLCAAVYESGGEAIIENPPDYGVFGLWSTHHGKPSDWRKEHLFEPRHCPLWLTPWAQAYRRCITDTKMFYFAQCTEKYTNLCATSGVGQLAQREMAPFDRKPCMCETAHAKQAVGKDAAAAATYPVKMNIALAKAIVRIVEKRIEGGKTGDLALAINLQRRAEALRPFWLLVGSQQTEEAITVQPKGARWRHAGDPCVQATLRASFQAQPGDQPGPGPGPVVPGKRRRDAGDDA